jgi:hypothetical protein
MIGLDLLGFGFRAVVKLRCCIAVLRITWAAKVYRQTPRYMFCALPSAVYVDV